MKPYEDIFPLNENEDPHKFNYRLQKFLDLNPAGLICKPYKLKALPPNNTPNSGKFSPAWYGKNEFGVEQVVGLCKRRDIR